MANVLVGAFALAYFFLKTYVEAHGNTDGWIKPPTPNGVTAYDFNYKIDGKSYTGYVAYPTDLWKGERFPLPGVLIAHQWYGLGEMEQYRAEEMVAKLGYVAFALDVYGTDIRAHNDAEAEALMEQLESDPAELHKRVDAGLSQLRHFDPQSAKGPSHLFVNASALTANGYCFGGLMVLELARTGNDIIAVTSFHGELGNLTSQTNDKFQEPLSIQVHHAQDDFQGDQVLRDFEAEMTSQNVSHWTTTYYGHMEHGWTDPSSEYYRYVEAESAHAAMFGLYQILLPS